VPNGTRQLWIAQRRKLGAQAGHDDLFPDRAHQAPLRVIEAALQREEQLFATRGIGDQIGELGASFGSRPGSGLLLQFEGAAVDRRNGILGRSGEDLVQFGARVERSIALLESLGFVFEKIIRLVENGPETKLFACGAETK